MASSSDVTYRGQICDEEILFKDGNMHISDKPGLGIDINEDEISKYPSEVRNLRHYQGILTDIRPPDEKKYFS